MSSGSRLTALRRQVPAVLPSLLLCDFGHLEREVRRLEEAGVAALHLDVMDGHFVPNLTYGLPIVEALRRLTSLPLDAHLMIAEPQRYARQFVEAGADLVTFHIEAAPNPAPVFDIIEAAGAAAGLALNPATPLAAIEPWLDRCELVLVMSVHPGFGGQAFDVVALDKVAALRQQRPELLIEIDGGVNDQTIGHCAAAGAELLVVGSAIFRYDDYALRVRELTARARDGRAASHSSLAIETCSESS